MRRLLPVGAIALALAVPSTAVAPQAQQPPPEYWQQRGCTKEYPSRVSYHRISQLIRTHRVLTLKAKRKATRYAVCVSTRAKSKAVWRHYRRSLLWRTYYPHVWPIRRSQVDVYTLSRLRTLRGCETGGLDSGYYYTGHHDGAYQYLPGTWQRAQSYYQQVTGKRVRGWTSRASYASPAHQDVVTAVFFPTHSGEWSCNA